MNEKKFIPVMLTPFRENGNIDFDALTQLTHFYINSGAKGLFANCQSSEMFELSPDERLQLVAHVVKTAAGKVPVVATGNFGNSIEEQAHFIKKIDNLGVQAVILLTNQLAEQGATESILEANVRHLLAVTDAIPLGFYECPVPYKVILSPGLLARLVATGRIIYHKDTCLDLEQVQQKNKRCNTTKGFGLYDAYMVHAVESLKSGSAGLSCIQGNYFPELVAWLCTNYNKPERAKEVEAVQQFFIDEMDVMHEDYPKSAKYYLWKKGLLLSTYTRESADGCISYKTKGNMDRLEIKYKELTERITGIKTNIGKIV